MPCTASLEVTSKILYLRKNTKQFICFSLELTKFPRFRPKFSVRSPNLVNHRSFILLSTGHKITSTLNYTIPSKIKQFGTLFLVFQNFTIITIRKTEQTNQNNCFYGSPQSISSITRGERLKLLNPLIFWHRKITQLNLRERSGEVLGFHPIDTIGQSFILENNGFFGSKIVTTQWVNIHPFTMIIVAIIVDCFCFYSHMKIPHLKFSQ